MSTYDNTTLDGMNGKKAPYIKDPLLPKRVQSTPFRASYTQHMWELLVGNRTAVLTRHARGRRIRNYPDLCASKFNKTNLRQGSLIHAGFPRSLTRRLCHADES